jgi:TonB-linked SusC/RagA family outer membrane protein
MKSKILGLFTLFIVLLGQLAVAQTRSVSGIVSDSSGEPLTGVTVVVKGTTSGVQTDFDGKFTIEASSTQTIVFSYLGMKTQEVLASSTNLIIKLQDDTKQLDDVVVIGYGTQKRSEVTSSISKINGSAIQGLVTPSFESQLAGRASGVQVTTSTGIIGAAPRIRIRGIASINSGTDPLYVVDGMPIYSGDLGGYASANGLGDINPNDIESFEILKDGAATAIYGSRAANGVVLITTKKGKKGDMVVNYNTVVGFASPFKTFDLLKTADFIRISNEKRTNISPTNTLWAAGTDFDTDWQKAVLNSNALQVDHNLSFSGGNDKTKYFMSLGYAEQDGIAESNSMIRYNVRSNLDHKINKWLSFGGSIALTQTEYDGLNVGRNSLSGNMFNAIRQAPNTPIYDPANPTGYNINLSNGFMGRWDNLTNIGDNITNIVYVLDKNKQQSKIRRTLINTYLSADLFKGMNYRFQASVDQANTEGFLYWNPTHGDGRGSVGRLQNNTTDLTRWNLQHILNYNKTFFDYHNVAATAVVEYQKETNKAFTGVGTGLVNEFYNQNLVTGSYSTQESSGGLVETGIMSYIGRLSYNYKQKYFLQGSIRRDGLSKLAADRRWNSFVGYSAGWNIAKESFFEGATKYINEFKIRASYSEVGNTDIGAFPYLNLASPQPYGSLNGIGVTQFGNSILSWEVSEKFDFGVDFGLLDNKLKMNVDYFKNDNKRLVMSERTPASLGVPSTSVPGGAISKNIGNIVNTGFEFGVQYNILDTPNLTWSVNANLTLQDNKVNSTPGGNDINGGTFTDASIAPNLIIREGESINSLFGWEYWGVNPSNGFPVYYKADGSLVQGNPASSSYTTFDPANPGATGAAASLLQSDKKILGNTLPKYFGGIGSTLTYKNFDLNFLFRFSGGNKVFNATRRELMNLNFNNNSTEILGRWQSAANPGDGWTPLLWAGGNNFVNQANNASTRFVEDGDFISLDNLTLGYSFPKEFLSQIKVDNIRIFVQGQNLFMLTKYKGLDPEMETAGVDLNGTPRARIFSMGVNVKL